MANGDIKNFTYFALFWIILGWLGFLATLAGFFYWWIFAGYFAISAVVFLRTVLSRKISFKNLKEISLISPITLISLITLIAIIIFSFFTTPTIFSGRDQGAISEAAIRLAQNHQLEFSTPTSEEFFNIYGAGKALNFPGFYYTDNGNLITQFPLPYISWLAIFYSLFGLAGLIIANAVLFFIFALSFYFLGRIFMESLPSLALLILALTFFSFFWFFKFTLSENMALALIWFAAFQLIIFFREFKTFNYFILLSAAGLLTFTRIEGFAVLAMLAIILTINKNTRNFISADKLKRIMIPFSVFAIILTADFFINLPFFKEIGRVIVHNSAGVQAFVGSEIYTLKVFSIYGIIQFLILGLAGIIYLLRKKEYLKLAPFFFVLPAFLYLIDSNISSDHPWMLRRYVFAILPALIFYSVFLLYFWLYHSKKIIFGTVLILLFAFNMPLFIRYAFFSENKNLLAQTEEISRNFSDKDLILVDRLASGDGWMMISGPLSFLYGRQAVYFFNPEDFAKLDLLRFNKIYLVVSDENIVFYQNSPMGNKMEFYKDYELKTRRLDISGENKLPDKINISAKGKIFEIIK